MTVQIPADLPRAIIYSDDGQQIAKWGGIPEKTDISLTNIVGVHGLKGNNLRLREYSPSFDTVQLTAHEKFLLKIFANG